MQSSRESDPSDFSETDFASALMPAAKKAKLPSARMLEAGDAEKKQQMVISDDLLTFVAQCIIADLETWGIMLTSMHGKDSLQRQFITYLSNHQNPLTRGEGITTEMVSKWIKAGFERADAETKRRATGMAPGRACDSDQSVKEVDRIWVDLVNDWNELLRAKPTTNRYTTPPEHLRRIGYF
jgi:hypothetical protein